MTTTATPTPTTGLGRELRVLFLINGIANVAGGAVLLPVAGVLGALAGLAPSLITAIAVFYLGYGAAMWFAATRAYPPRIALAGLIAVNPVWGLVCVLLAGGVLAAPTVLGATATAAEAATVTGLAALQAAAYRHRAGH